MLNQTHLFRKYSTNSPRSFDKDLMALKPILTGKYIPDTGDRAKNTSSLGSRFSKRNIGIESKENKSSHSTLKKILISHQL